MIGRQCFALFFALAFGLIVLAAGAQGDPADRPTSDWNVDAIRWYDFEEGMMRIKAVDRPGILVFYTDWCPHCKNYSWVFHDPKVVELAKSFVMIRVDRDKDGAINDRYGKHGGYVPRTLFLTRNAKVDWTTKGSYSDYPYYLDEHAPGELKTLMRRFLKKASAPAKRH